LTARVSGYWNSRDGITKNRCNYLTAKDLYPCNEGRVATRTGKVFSSARRARSFFAKERWTSFFFRTVPKRVFYKV